MRSPRLGPRQTSEVEAVVIIKENFDTVLKELTGLRSILNYNLEPRPSKTIRDRYFDTVNGDLRRRRVNFRTREIDGAVFISVKSNARRTVSGATLRKEVEVPWSIDALNGLIKDLRLDTDRSVDLHHSSGMTPLQSMGGIGLQIIQDRETKREVRNISSELRPTIMLGELAIDQVTYHIGDNDIPITEVEVEEKAEKSSSVVKDVTKALIDAYRPAIQKWAHGKFVTGLAIQSLLDTRSADSLLDHGHLRPEAFNLIDRTVRSSARSRGLRMLKILRLSN